MNKMRPLFIFETEDKKKSSWDLVIDRVNDNLIPNLQSKTFQITFCKLEDFGDTSLLVFTKENKSILVIPWIRPYIPNRTLVQELLDYPRLNITKSVKKLDENKRIEEMYKLVDSYQLYFLVMLQRTNNNDLYWLGKYTDIPIKYWQLVSRRESEGLGRIKFAGYQDYKFVKIIELKKQISKLLRKNEN